MTENGVGQKLCEQRETVLRPGVTCFPKGGSSGNCKTYELMKPVFSELWNIYDEYIRIMDAQGYYDDLPWIFTERSIVGHLTSAAFNANCICIEEYQIERKDEKPMGRADWWMGTKHDTMKGILAETKQMWLSCDVDSWGSLRSILAEAEAQLKGYKAGNQSKNFRKLVICFVRPYFRDGEEVSDENLRKKFKIWCDEDAYWPEGTDYFTCYWLNSVKGRGYKTPDNGSYLYRPGLIICCREIPRAHKTV